MNKSVGIIWLFVLGLAISCEGRVIRKTNQENLQNPAAKPVNERYDDSMEAKSLQEVAKDSINQEVKDSSQEVGEENLRAKRIEELLDLLSKERNTAVKETQEIESKETPQVANVQETPVQSPAVQQVSEEELKNELDNLDAQTPAKNSEVLSSSLEKDATTEDVQSDAQTDEVKEKVEKKQEESMLSENEEENDKNIKDANHDDMEDLEDDWWRIEEDGNDDLGDEGDEDWLHEESDGYGNQLFEFDPRYDELDIEDEEA